MFFVLVMFLDARRDAGWLTAEHGVRGSIDGVELTCESRWWGNQWNVTGESAFPIPEKLTLFVSERGMDHGFWRDLRVGDSRFDARFFVFCDTPALLPILVGEATRGALSNTGPNRHDITLYVRDGRVKTTGITMKDDTQSIDRHLAIHRGLAEDHRAFLARWKERMDSAAGRADAAWPPTATLLRPSGALLVNLAWTAPTTRDASDWDEAADSLRTEITAHDDRARLQWSLHEVSATTPCTHVLANRRFVLVGKLPFALPVLENIVRQAQLASVVVHQDRITVGVRGIATSRQIEGAVRVIHLVVDATADHSSPYR